MPTDPIHTTGGLPVSVDHRSGVVLLEVGRGSKVAFAAKDAAALGQQLIDAAKDSIHADRLERRRP
ncbi:hypothetical protein J2X60_002991 [Curtobacterium sp. 320]|uniref:hypothetical protein n=1 Tax=Curtobacterium sp. 320 TaxID=2817749 RepID=UPI00286297BF|nr:hypothetical protein [Curtobacterium sp. 320]MDR6574332.1 hypothetical protein [Curtobacterium sp. 320]